MSKPFEIIKPAEMTWKQGVPYSQTFDDRYFSSENGLQESLYVFIEGNQLIERWRSGVFSFVIGEIGFGSGLNFLLAWSLWRQYGSPSGKLQFISCEKHPLNKADLAHCLALWPDLAEYATDLLTHYPILTPGCHTLSFDEGRVDLILMLGEATALYEGLLHCGDAVLERSIRHSWVDAWFLDGFSPAKNPDAWQASLWRVLNTLSKPGTTLASFTAAGHVQRSLQAAGFRIEKKAGFGQKREMITGAFETYTGLNDADRITPWHINTIKHTDHDRVLILGAGLAGCYLAHALAKRGRQVILLDQHETIATGASGNRQAVLYPKISAYHAPFTELMLMGYLFAIHKYQNLRGKSLSGLLQLTSHEDEQAALQSWLKHYPDLGRFVDEEEIMQLAGVSVDAKGLFFPEAGWLDMPELCQILISDDLIEWHGGIQVDDFEYTGQVWHAGGHEAETLIIANGHRCTQFDQTRGLPLQPIYGQMSIILDNAASASLKLPICGTGHILPAQAGRHHVGATYHLGFTDINSFESDNIENINRLRALPIQLTWSERVIGHWGGVRAATPDYLPLVGPVMDEKQFNKQFESLSTNAKRWLPDAAPALPGLYVCSGFGSRGLVSIPLCAEWLVSRINGDFFGLPRRLVQAISPARFLYRSMIRSQMRQI